MFGQRLKSWMEAHLGRPRHKSTSHHHHQNQKQRNSSFKEISSLHSSACSGTGTTTSQSTGTTSVIGNNTSSVSISSPQPLYTNSNLNSASHNFQSHHLHSSNSATEKNSNNSDRIPCPSQEDFSSTTAATSSSSALQAQQQQQQHHQDHDHLLQQDDLDQEHLHHLNHQHHHHQQQLLQKHNSQLRGNQQQQQQQPSVSTTAILLGSFSNNLNLSSPDTGYSTDGYSPKSVYPALSFESSGKSTPKSSYTISSLVSSERLHLNNSSSCTSSKSISGGGPSKNSSISNGLELEEEEVCCNIPSGEPTSMSMSLQTQSRDSMTTTAGAGTGTTTHSDLSLLPEQQSDRGRKDDERSNGEGNHGQSITGIGIGPGPGLGTELKDDAKSNNLHLRSFSNSTGTDCSSGVINVNRTLPSFTEAVPSTKTVESSAVELLVSNSKGNAPVPIQSHGFPCSAEKHEHYNHRRTESMDEQRVRHEGIEISSSSSSKVTSASGAGGGVGGGGGGGRNIRTSLLLTSSSDIPPECNPGLKNAFSICSPRRQRTRIKTNPWISLTQHHDVNFHVHCRMGNKETSVVGLGPGSVPTGTNNVCSINFESVNGAEDETDHQNNFEGLSGEAEEAEEEQLDSTEGKMVAEINNAGAAGNTEKNGSSGGGVGGGSEIVSNNNNNSTSIFYRISTSTSASDSGKGTLEPGTNRNSTESSCLLSDSTSGSNSGGSARNSIISPENTISSGSGSLIPNINSVHGRLEQCVSSLVPGQVPTSSSSSSAAVKSTSSAAPSICINNSNSTKPSVKRLNSTSVIGIDEGKVKSVGKRAEAVSSLAAVTSAGYAMGDNFPSMVDKETDILSDWANTDDDDVGEEDDEEDGDGDNDEDEEDDNECITPTPSSPDVTFNHSSSCSSKMEFIEVSDRVRHPNTNPNINLNGNKSGFMPGQDPYQHNMNLPTTCYQSVALSPKQCTRPLPVTIPLQIPDAYAYDHVNNLSHHRQHNQPLGLGSQDIGETEVAPAGTAARCLNTRIPNNNTGLQSKNSHNHNASHTIARGAIGFFRKMFKKGSACSSQRNGGGGSGFSGGKGKFLLRSSRSSNGSENGREDNDIDNNLIIPVGLLSPETVVVSNYPLSNTKPLSPAINGNFLTPTPNAFRRRSACPGGSDFTPNDAGRTAKLPHHTKAIKTDIIRLPPQATCSSSSFNSDSSAHHHHHHHRQGPMEQEPPSQSSSTTSHSISNSTGHPNPIHLASYNSPNNNNVPYYPLQSNTNSTTGSSSAHSMSIMSTSSMSMTEAHNQKAIEKLPIFSQNHNIEDLIAYENLKHELLKPKPYPRQSQSQSPFMSNSNSIFSQHLHHHQNNGAPSNYHNRPSHSSPMLPPKQVGHHNQAQIQNHNQGMIVLGAPKVCPYDSPRLPSNGGNSRISSPSFNNYSPIHRIVVTGGNHLLSRGGGAPPTHGPPPPPSPAPPSSFHPAHNNNNNHHHSPVPPPRTPNSQLHYRPPPIPPTTHASPLINHRHSSSASTATGQSNGTPGSYHHPFVTCSPSPILRNPRYQYITSSNQNSPLLNIPKRLSNVPLNNFPRGNVSLSNKVITTVPASPVPAPAPVFHSPSFTRAPSHTNTNSNSNSNESNYFKQNPSRGSPLNNSMAPNHHRQTHRAHIQNTNNNTNHHHKNQSHPSKGIFPPHPSRGPDGFHTNHYYSSPITRDTSQSQSKFSRSNGMIPNRERGQERIYETVDDSEEEEDDLRSDEGDGEGGVFEFRVPEFGQEVGRREQQESDVRRQSQSQSQRRGVFVESDSFAMINPSHHAHGPGRNSTTTMNSGGSSSGGGGSGGSSSQRCKSKSTSKSKSRRSKREPTFSPIPQPQPPLPPRSFPLMLGTYLSETETQLLEADRNTDRKYKRLISEAEALLREISIEKTQPLPWLSRYARESLRHDDCPQSDPLRRKAYDCWALRRLQQELAGCCASPPVLHRSRLHITSPVSPSQNRNFSLAQDLPEFPFMQDRRSSISSIHSHTHSNAPY